MNIRQQLNNSFFALFIAALLIGARDLNNQEKFNQIITIRFAIYFLFLFFLRLKIYFDDNYNLSAEGSAGKMGNNFIVGYLTSIIGWIIFPIAAYRLYDNLDVSYLCLIFVILLNCVWTICVIFSNAAEGEKLQNKRWLMLNVIYIILVLILWVFLKLPQYHNKCLEPIIYLLLIASLIFDYVYSKTLQRILG